ncbi:hypothetical protein KSD_42160 [Ktedonobacter sp. SOSP1-85]|nr:hypothetical protein KSD_42160 [Ktedonobacter sp. SOSP1-85]
MGVSKRAREGVGLGRVQEGQIIQAITKSNALTGGAILDIQELELHIDGLGPDKVSDLIANVIKNHLADFTQEVCDHYNVETRPCVVNLFWDADTLQWASKSYDLPVKGRDSYILIPKDFVRREQDTVNHRHFYDHYVLDFYVREKQTALDSLAAALKTPPTRVTKSSIKKDPPISSKKTDISNFIQKHPEVIGQYRQKLEQGPQPLDYAVVSGKAEIDDKLIQDTLKKLDKTPAGQNYATQYQDIVFELLTFIFDWCIQNLEKEYTVDQNRGRIDIIGDRYGEGFLKELCDRFNATSIPMECKNYNGKLGNNEFNQLADRLSPETGLLGFLFCRRIKKREDIIQHVSGRYMMHKKCIFVFDDQRLKSLVEMRHSQNYKGIEALLRKMLREVRYGSYES